MRLNKKSIALQRRQLDKRIKNLLKFKTEEIPPSGWIKSFREALGMPAAALAKKLGMSRSGIVKLEKAEMCCSISLNNLKKAADALNCDLKYIIIPKGDYHSLEEMLDEQVLKAAKKEIKEVHQTMSLENQALDKKDIEHQIKTLAKELKEKLPSKIWEA